MRITNVWTMAFVRILTTLEAYVSVLFLADVLHRKQRSFHPENATATFVKIRIRESNQNYLLPFFIASFKSLIVN